MSASPIARQSFYHAQLIPSMRKVLISEPSQMPDVYSSTPNGTLYSTTPGGKNEKSFFFVWKIFNRADLLTRTLAHNRRLSPSAYPK